MHTKAIRSTMITAMPRDICDGDPLAPARGIMIGSGICLVFWSTLAALILL